MVLIIAIVSCSACLWLTSPNSLSYSASRIQRQELFPLPHVFIITPVLKSLQWLPVKYRILFKVAILTFKILHGPSPDHLKELLTIKEISRYNLQSNNELIHRPSIISNLKKTLGDCSFKMAAAPAAVWNKLPPNNIRNETNFSKFKSSLIFSFYIIVRIF